MHDHDFSMTDADAFPADPRVSRIIEIFAKETGADPAALKPNATLADLGVESLDLTMAVFQLEEEFDIEIPVVAESGGVEFRRVGDLVAQVIAVLDRKAASAAPCTQNPAPS